MEAATLYLESALAGTALVCVERHLAGCAGCRSYVTQLRQTLRWLSVLPTEPVAPEARASLLATFRACRSGWMR